MGGDEAENTRMMRPWPVFTLGELAQICPHHVNKLLFVLMQSVIFQKGTKKLSDPLALPLLCPPLHVAGQR